MARSGYWSDLPPKTPRMPSVALPSSPVVNKYPRTYAPTETPLMNSRPFMPPSQLPPPTPSSGRRHTLPQESQPPPRQRTSSNVSVGSKPLKGILKKPSPPAEAPPSNHYYTDSEQLIKSSESVPVRRSSLKSSNGHHAHRGSQDSTDRTSSKGRETPIEDLKKAANLVYSYDRETRIPMVEKSRLKAEVISLNWVLRCQEGLRKRTRENANLCRVFDIAFQPDPHPQSPYGRYKPGARLWDMVHRMYLPDQTVRTYFEMPASSHCNLYKMHIIVSANPEWHTILERKRGIRCIDVFRAVYDMLQKPLTRRELSMIPHGSIRFCEDAQGARIRDSPVLEEVERSRGILRIDSFVNYRFFKGLTQKDDVWMLETCSPDGRPFPQPLPPA
ncbi:hypothetical protein WG66_014544 [Moniliophthora roreri]|nr:hypothetical protein WG66_014544 [Moniliophthora roreri]